VCTYVVRICTYFFAHTFRYISSYLTKIRAGYVLQTGSLMCACDCFKHSQGKWLQLFSLLSKPLRLDLQCTKWYACRADSTNVLLLISISGILITLASMVASPCKKTGERFQQHSLKLYVWTRNDTMVYSSLYYNIILYDYILVYDCLMVYTSMYENILNDFLICWYMCD
jgi:hypothetical protein